MWGDRRGSNPRQPESQSGTLPTELRSPLFLCQPKPAKNEDSSMNFTRIKRQHFSAGETVYLKPAGLSRPDNRRPSPQLPDYFLYTWSARVGLSLPCTSAHEPNI